MEIPVGCSKGHKPDGDAMAETRKVQWESVTPDWWTSCIGYVRQEEGDSWAGYVYRNTRVGKAWTERKPGFASALAAKRWVEREAEDC